MNAKSMNYTIYARFGVLLIFVVVGEMQNPSGLWHDYASITAQIVGENFFRWESETQTDEELEETIKHLTKNYHEFGHIEGDYLLSGDEGFLGAE